MRSQSLLKLVPQAYPYRPAIALDDGAEALKRMYPKTIQRYSDQVEFVADVVNNKGVSDLEKLATALYVTRELGLRTKAEERAAGVREYKPHVEYEDSLSAVQEVDQMLSKAARLIGA